MCCCFHGDVEVKCIVAIILSGVRFHFVRWYSHRSGSQPSGAVAACFTPLPRVRLARSVLTDLKDLVVPLRMSKIESRSDTTGENVASPTVDCQCCGSPERGGHLAAVVSALLLHCGAWPTSVGAGLPPAADPYSELLIGLWSQRGRCRRRKRWGPRRGNYRGEVALRRKAVCECVRRGEERRGR